jgi:hypothetical protein
VPSSRSDFICKIITSGGADVVPRMNCESGERCPMFFVRGVMGGKVMSKP